MQTLKPQLKCASGISRAWQSCRSGLSKTTVIVGLAVWTAAIGGLMLVWQQRQIEAVPATSNDEAESINTADDPVTLGESSVKVGFPARELPDFNFDKATGGTLSLADLKGKRWVASFVFTRCTSTCPTITRSVMELHDRVQESAPDVMFVTFTVDPKFDSADVLKTYSETFTRGNWDRWAFLTGSQQEIFELIVNGFGLYVKENLGESRMPGFEVAHSNRVVLVNEDGIPVGTFLGTVPADMVALRRILTGREEFPTPGPPGPGFTISTTDGQPVEVQLLAVPVEDNGADKTEPDTEPETATDASDEPATDDCSPDESEADDEEAQDAQSAAVGSDSQDTSGGSPSAGLEPEAAIVPQATSSAVAHNARIDQRLPAWARQLPSVNAGLNSLAAILLLLGFVAIKQGKRTTHRNFMITAFLTSAVFLACYLAYHYALGKYTGEHGKRFVGGGLAGTVYPWILWPHVVLAMLVPVLAIRVFQHAFAGRWDAHKALARITFPIWMFVSVTGVIIYGMLYHWPVPTESIAPGLAD